MTSDPETTTTAAPSAGPAVDEPSGGFAGPPAVEPESIDSFPTEPDLGGDDNKREFPGDLAAGDWAGSSLDQTRLLPSENVSTTWDVVPKADAVILGYAAADRSLISYDAAAGRWEFRADIDNHSVTVEGTVTANGAAELPHEEPAHGSLQVHCGGVPDPQGGS